MFVSAISPVHLVIALATLAVLALVVVAIVATWRTATLTLWERVVLTVILVLFPVFGLIAWLIYWMTRRRSAGA